MVVKNGCVMLVLISCSLHGMSEEMCSLSYSKVCKSVPLLYPEMPADDIKKVVSVKEIEWARDLKKAFENDDVDTVKSFLEAEFFTLQEEHLFFVYNQKRLKVLRYFLEKRLERYATYSLLKKHHDNFFTFVKTGRPSGSITDNNFDNFFQTFENYFWDMRYLKNVQAYDKHDQIKAYQDYVALLPWAVSTLLTHDEFSPTCYYDTIKKRFKAASSEEKEHILDCVRLFKHEEEVLYALHFPQDFEKTNAVRDVHFKFISKQL